MARGKSKPAAAVSASPTTSGGTAIRTTFNPGDVIRVGDAELLDLKRQGLVFEVVGESDAIEDDTTVPPTGDDETDQEGAQP